jgi:hypothetical protein
MPKQKSPRPASSAPRSRAASKTAREKARTAASAGEASAARAKGRGAGQAPAPVYGWGGRRPGAGRPPGPEPRQALHRRRDDHQAEFPVLVTLRTKCKSLRSPALFPSVRESVYQANCALPARFRVVHFTIRAEKILLIVEARDLKSLIEGVRGISIRFTRSINPLLGQTGRFFADRWRSQELETPAAVRKALVEVLANPEKQERGKAAVDVYSSAPYFRDFVEYPAGAPIDENPRLLPRSIPAPESPPVLPATT